MPKGKRKKRQHDELPDNFDSLEEFWTFWDTHSTADYEDLMEDVDMQVNIHASKVCCAVAKDLLAQIQPQARRQGVSTETLINLWLREKAMETTESK